MTARYKTSNAEFTRPMKVILEKQKFNYLTSDPENHKGHNLIRKKFGLSEPNAFKYGRS
jgi:hypothetical protein